MMKDYRSVLAAIVCVLTLHLTQLRADDGDSVTFKSDDGKVQLVMPTGWVQQTSSNPSAALEARNEDYDAYVLIIIADRADPYLTLNDYASGRRDDVLSHLVKSKSSDPESLEIGGYKAVRFEIHGTRADSKLEFGYFLTIIQMRRHYVEVISWSPEKHFPENADTLRDAAKHVTYSGDQ